MRPESRSDSPPTDRPRGLREHSPSGIRKAKQRRAALEWLEPRTLLATLPAPAVLGNPVNLSGSDTSPAANVDASAPSIAVDPLNSNRLVAFWAEYNTNPTTPTARIQGAVSNNGGVSWTGTPAPSVFSDPTTSNPTIPFTRVVNASVGIDRSGNVYVAALQTNAGGNAGVVAIQKYTFSGNSLVAQGPTRILYDWFNAPESTAALHVSLVVDSTPATAPAADGLVHSNPYSGNVYVAWSTLDAGPTVGGDQLAPQAIYAVGSSDGGQTFTTPRRISDGGFNRTGGGAVVGTVGDRMPRMAINPAPPSDPANPVRGGRVSFTWDDYATGTGPGISEPYDVIRHDRTEGVLLQRFAGASNAAIGDNTTTSYPLVVNITDTRFVTVQDLDVEVAITHPAVNQLSVVLVPPPGSGLNPIPMFAANAVTGTAVGGGPQGVAIFDAQAAAAIGGASPRGIFRPTGGLGAVAGLTPAQLSGTWTLQITDNAVNTPVPAQTLNSWALRFSSGLTPQLNGVEVARTSVLGSSGQGGSVDTAASTININASPVIAVDATLGADSPNRGRIYVAYTDRGRDTDNPADNTDIYLAFSDDGTNWNFIRRVSDDLGDRDGFSGADFDTGFLFGDVATGGRPQFMPEVAVDQSTGALLVQFYDVRHDASRGRVATYLTSSIDGGQTFSPQVFVNEAETVNDVATGRDRVVGPIPDNQSGGNPNTDDVFAFGTRQGLAALNGNVFSAWSGNLNGGPNAGLFLDIRVARSRIASGPRVVDGTGGVVGTTDASGTPEARSFVVTFDRPIYFDPTDVTDPTNFTTADVAIRYLSPDRSSSEDITATNITPLGGNQYRIEFPGRTRPGTYSYAIGPGIRDLVRAVDAGGNLVRLGNLMDQDADAVTDVGQGVDVRFATPRPAPGGVPLAGPFVRESLPLIVPGPRVVATRAVLDDGTTAPTSGPALNSTVVGVEVEFDRDMQVSTFTVDDVVRILGPAGEVARSSLLVTPVGEADGVARTFRVSFAPQQLSGTYQVVLGSNIQSVAGHLVDANGNAGVDVLRGGDTSTSVELSFASGQVPRTIPGGGTVESTVVVDKAFEITDVDVQLNISHPNVPDLRAELVAPDGTTILLFSGVGATGSRADFTNTIFDSEAAQSITAGTPPFSDRYRPQDTLEVLYPPDDTPTPTPAGTYTLRVTNTGSTQGTLNSWRLIMDERVPGTGLGEPVADRSRADFRIFTLAADEALSSSTWTPVGPAPISEGEGAGRVTAIAVDPSDPSGNTVYVGGASGGVWKTNNFLTTDAGGPTWIPLTDAVQANGLNIGGITVFGRNNDPNQSIVMVATGEGDTGTPGVGFLRSTDGGASWELLDSADNRVPFAQRAREFVGTTSFEVVADPRPTPTGEAIFYAALSGAQGGLWRSTDSGDTWQRLRAGQANDVVLDPASGAPTVNNPTGNLQVVYAAFRGEGVFISPNQGQQFNLMVGGVGKPQLRDGDLFDQPTIPVTNQGATPNGAKGRIVLAKPALPSTGDPDQDARERLMYQGWLYAAVATPDNRLDGLYLTKDQGQNWTRLRLPTGPTPSPSLPQYPVTPSNDTGLPDVDPTANAEFQLANYALALTVDPTNPNVVYLGGTRNGGGETSLIRVDSTFVHDPHAFFLSSDLTGGPVRRNFSTGPAVLKTGDQTIQPDRDFDPRLVQYLNLYRNPVDPFDADTTIYVNNTASINNSGAGVRWSLFDQAINNTTDLHEAFSLIDPLTGRGRLIFGVDRGVFTAVDAGDGSLLTQLGQGNTAIATGSRNGNLQISQIYYGAVQPSRAAAEIAGALFYAQTDSTGSPRSSPNFLQTGDLEWDSPRLPFEAGDLGGVGVATDPTGSGASYQYNWRGTGDAPKASIFGTGNDFRTDFFLVDLTANGDPHDVVGRTNGLLQSSGGSLPDPQWPRLGGSNFAVNPINPDQIVISAPGSGRVFRTLDRGLNWLEVGLPSVLGNSYFPALAFGAPQPGAPAGSVGDYIIGGNQAGGVYVTFTGGGAAGTQWTQINSGDLAGNTSPVRAIVTNPIRGTFEAYALTSDAVYHIADTRPTSGATWTDVTANLFAITHQIFGDADAVAPLLAADGLRSLAVDWRYAIPDDFGNPPTNPTDPTGTHPILYVGGVGGVFASYDDGAAWSRFPSAFANSLNTTPQPPGAGGGLPVAEVSDLDLSLGNVNRATGLPVSQAGDPNLLMASTFGRGAFAIRLGPVVFPESLRLVVGGRRIPAGGDPPVIFPSDLVFEGFSAQSAAGNEVRLRAFEIGPDDEVLRELPQVDAAGSPVVPTTDTAGNFTVRIAPGAFPTPGVKRIGIQAEQGGTTGNIALFELEVSVPPPTLLDSSDTGRSPSDRITNDTSPSFQLDPAAGQQIRLFRRLIGTTEFVLVGGPDGTGQVTDPGPVPDGAYEYAAGIGGIFSTSLVVTIDATAPAPPDAPAPLGGDVTSASDPSFRIEGVEPGAEVRLYRRRTSEPVSPTPLLVGSTIAGEDGVVTIQDLGPLSDGDYEYSADQIDLAGNVGPRGTARTLLVRGSTVPAPTATLALLAADDTGQQGDNITANRRPRLPGTTAAGATVQLVDAAGNPLGAAVQAGPDGAFTLQFPAPLADGTYAVRARVTDLTGNIGQSDPLVVTIDTTPAPGITTLGLAPESDTGLRGDLRTSARRPFLTGTTEPGAFVEIFAAGQAEPIAQGLADAQGRFRLQGPGQFANGTVMLRARARDAAGNLGDFGTPIALTIESASGDFDNDGRADLALYRPGTGPDGSLFVISLSAGGTRVRAGVDFRSTDPASPLANAQLRPTDIPISGDFDGDGVLDVGVFRPSSDREPTASEWIILGSQGGPRSVLFGGSGLDVPAVGDFDGDGRDDIAVFRPVSDLLPGAAEWFILPSSGSQAFRVSFGAAGGLDLPAVADYDGDGRDDIATFRPNSDLLPGAAHWFILPSGPNDLRFSQKLGGYPVLFGEGGVDQPVPGDYDGDGRDDIATFRPSTSEWFILRSGLPTDVAGLRVPFGAVGDQPAPGDYDGDGIADLATFRASTGRWTVRQSSDGRDVPTAFGTNGDVPLLSPLAYRDPRSDSIARSTPSQATAGSSIGQAAQVSADPAPNMGRLASQLGSRPARARSEALAHLRALRGDASGLRGLLGSFLSRRGDGPRA